MIINECGVDPGTDHMSAMRVIHDVERRGGHIVSFTSYCGGVCFFTLHQIMRPWCVVLCL